PRTARRRRGRGRTDGPCAGMAQRVPGQDGPGGLAPLAGRRGRDRRRLRCDKGRPPEAWKTGGRAMQDRTFFRELLTDGARDFKAGRLDRRDFLALCAIAGFAPYAVSIGDAEAAANEVVLWNWGGDANKCHTEAFGGPFSKDTGLGFKIDSSGPLQGKI